MGARVATDRSHGPPDQRCAILEATLTPSGQLPFGAPLVLTRTSAYLKPGGGTRSLASVVIPAEQLRFSVAQREGLEEPDFRVALSVPGLEGRILAVKDHFLLRQAEQAAKDLDGRVKALQRSVSEMGERVIVRLGLTRAFVATPHRGEGLCWLMADGFFSLKNPQP